MAAGFAPRAEVAPLLRAASRRSRWHTHITGPLAALACLTALLLLTIGSDGRGRGPASLLSYLVATEPGQFVVEDPLMQLMAVDKQLDEKQRRIDERRASILRSFLVSSDEHAVKENTATKRKAAKQQLYLTSDATPSQAMLDRYWDSFTALPPSDRPGLGMAMSNEDLDAKIASLHNAPPCGSEEDCADPPSSAEINAAVAAEMKNSRMTKLYATMAGSGTMADGGAMMATADGRMATDERMADESSLMADERQMAQDSTMADNGGMAQDGTMAGAGLLAGDGVLAGDGILAGQGILSGKGGILAGSGILGKEGHVVSQYKGRTMALREEEKQREEEGPAEEEGGAARGVAGKGRARAGQKALQGAKDGEATRSAEGKEGKEGEGVYVAGFVDAWRPWEECAKGLQPACDGRITAERHEAVCRAVRSAGERGGDGLGGSALVSFSAAGGPGALAGGGRQREMLYGSQGRGTEVYEKKDDGWLDYNAESPHWGYDHLLNKNAIADGRPKMIEVEHDPHGGADMVRGAQAPFHPLKVDVEIPDSFQVGEYPRSVAGTHFRAPKAAAAGSMLRQEAAPRVAPRAVEAALAPLNAEQAALNRRREALWNQMAAVVLEREAGGERAGAAGVALEYYPGYSDPRYVPTGGYDAPYGLNGDGQYVDNWARVGTDWSCDQPTSGYLAPMPGGPPGMGRPPAMWRSAGSGLRGAGGGEGVQMLTGTKPAWTQSPLWSFFTNEGARKIRQMGGPDLGDEYVANVPPSASYMPPSGVEYQYAPPKREGAQ